MENSSPPASNQPAEIGATDLDAINGAAAAASGRPSRPTVSFETVRALLLGKTQHTRGGSGPTDCSC